MKLTKNTTPQARNYQCEICKSVLSHKDMFNNEMCGDCYDKGRSEVEND